MDWLYFFTDSGHGTLYTSSTSGVVYSESLPRHLYPNFGEIHDFYKVKSLRGVYITSQMNTDDSIHTVISYNRGATWEKIKRPPGVPCKDEKKVCVMFVEIFSADFFSFFFNPLLHNHDI